MEIVLVVLAVWLGISLAAAMLIGRFLHVADRRERSVVVQKSGMPLPLGRTRLDSGAAEVHETA